MAGGGKGQVPKQYFAVGSKYSRPSFALIPASGSKQQRLALLLKHAKEASVVQPSIAPRQETIPYRVARESLIFTEAFSSALLSCGYRLLEMATCHSLEELGILRPAAEDLGKTDLYFKEMRLLLEASSGLGKAFTLLKPSEGCGVIEAFAQTQGIYAIQVSVVSLARFSSTLSHLQPSLSFFVAIPCVRRATIIMKIGTMTSSRTRSTAPTTSYGTPIAALFTSTLTSL